jgi:NADH:ubiquinone oxidoreductase subunit 6 (subunit J)
MTIHTNKTLRSAVFLCLVMITNAGFFLLLGTEFLAIIQMLVYVSGIIILLIFVIMLTNTIEDDSTETPWIKKFIHIAIPCLFFYD